LIFLGAVGGAESAKEFGDRFPENALDKTDQRFYIRSAFHYSKLNFLNQS
jgi:hypothetical protein